ncbi:ABC transporter ATP-binding protein [Xylophilus sp.]|uniref:ABC transporter ATP-binding protein n=1 Tax=Xylophilus sp. TaxID=2653893 RepID=UPI0013B9B8E8|nr:sn-glycerol-3-phosphate ABC transporter ATP-binding protein UgpC [Xylophilus sp.]KAF1048217.1 MAG: sn-glycerol-3-phosphate import ATP-binding protein UgpC [Xylophilus sp.]
MATLELTGLSKRHGAATILHGIDLAVADGEFVTLVGPSGCGKSTLLRLIAGLDDASAGTIRIGGRDVGGLPPKARDVAMVFQSYALYPQMTVAQNMGFALELARVPRAEIDRKVAAAAEILGLETLLARLPGALSGGQRQRVAMGRAIVRDPAVFLFDEPLSNLDAQLRGAVRQEIRALHRRLGATMVYVTHDQVEAMTLADRIVVLRAGRVEQAGAPLDLYDRPANSFVAQFIGAPAMNLLPGRIDGAAFESAGGLRLPLAGALPPGAATLGVRPEHLSLAYEGGIAAEVVAVEQTGADAQLLARTAGGETLVALLRGRSALRPGETVRLAPQPGALHWFDARSGRRL